MILSTPSFFKKKIELAIDVSRSITRVAVNLRKIKFQKNSLG